MNFKRLSLIVEMMEGGLADGMSLQDIANKHNVSLKHLQHQLKLGSKVELEHVGDIASAKEIAMDHLVEDPNYYTKLKKMEGE